MGGEAWEPLFNQEKIYSKDHIIETLNYLITIARTSTGDKPVDYKITQQQHDKWLAYVNQSMMTILKLMIAYKNAKLACSNKDKIQCRVIAYAELQSELQSLLGTKLEVGESKRCQYIIKTLTHFTAVDMRIECKDQPGKVGSHKRNHLSISAFDPSNDMLGYQRILKYQFLKWKKQYTHVNSVYCSTDAIHLEAQTCMFFALKIAFGLAQIDNLYDSLDTAATLTEDEETKIIASYSIPALELYSHSIGPDAQWDMNIVELILNEAKEQAKPKIKERQNGVLPWSKLPAPLLKLCQPHEYLQQVPNYDTESVNTKGETLASYFNKHSALFKKRKDTETSLSTAATRADSVPKQHTSSTDSTHETEQISASQSADEGKLHNYAVWDFAVKYAQAILPILQELPEQHIKQIIDGKMEFPLAVEQCEHTISHTEESTAKHGNS